MKKMIFYLCYALIVSFTITACFQRPIQSSAANNNKTYTVEYLFEHDGCKVYRFMDMGKFVYFTKCNCNNSDVTSFSGDSTNLYITNHIINTN